MKFCLYLLHFTSHVGKSQYRRRRGNGEFHKNECQERPKFPVRVNACIVKPYVMLNVQNSIQSRCTLNSFCWLL
jgi:hypothetical protein